MAAIINQDQNRNQDQSLLIETGKFVITTLVIGAVVTTTGSASIPIGIGEVLSSVGTTITLNGIMGRWKASKQ
ncbi:17825_t:CDS:2 [Entrophospora sp. SA101]|nr:17825_t:CDS:2 [Entrophospora sp. SA101]